jgi:hypothetical protein
VAVCWGENIIGQSTPPDSVNGTDGTASAIGAGSAHSCAIRAEDAAVVCWARGTGSRARPRPSRRAALTTVRSSRGAARSSVGVTTPVADRRLPLQWTAARARQQPSPRASPTAVPFKP